MSPALIIWAFRFGGTTPRDSSFAFAGIGQIPDFNALEQGELNGIAAHRQRGHPGFVNSEVIDHLY